MLNYNENYVYITTDPKTSVRVEPAYNGEPSTLPLTLDEIKYVNNSKVFKNGILEFPSELEDEIYEVLRIDKDKVLKFSEIRDILLNPTKDGLTKILSITSLSDFDRVRGQFQKLKYDGYKLTLDVADLIDKRTKELFNNKIKSDVMIEKIDMENKNQKRVDELERQLEEMKAMLAQALATKTESVSVKEESIEDTSKNNVKKSPGRPKKNL